MTPERSQLVIPGLEEVSAQIGPGQFGETNGSYGVVVENTSSEATPPLDVSVTLVDSQGDAVTSRTHRLLALDPGVAGLHNSTRGDIAGIRNQIEVSDEAPKDGRQDDDLTVLDASASVAADGTTTSFTVSSANSSVLRGVEANAIWRDGRGEIIGGQSDYFDIAANTTQEYSLLTKAHTPDIAEVDVHLIAPP